MGAGHADTVIAWHGLARTGRDMDDIAAHLAQRWRVICPDTIGRGLSQWGRAPEREYCFAHDDPAMVMQFIHHPHDDDPWDAWDRLAIPVLVLRGADSDLLAPAVAQEMTTRGPRARLVTVPGCGHAPALHTPEHFAWVEDVLAGA